MQCETMDRVTSLVIATLSSANNRWKLLVLALALILALVLAIVPALVLALVLAVF